MIHLKTARRASYAEDQRLAPCSARPAISAAALIVLAAFTGPAQVAIRQPHSRPDNLRELAFTLRDHARPGDAVLYVPAGNWMCTLPYPDWVARLDT
ncbi:hypothetical protein [Nonomuraea sp. NPDC050786]|uniref:hypothetical protein n=1 Tax=Nonomuraea sp. NPDC050786 TaxID=3154840 RepID=UPI0033D52A6E